MSSLLKKDEITHQLSSVRFDFYTPEEIKRISMKQLTVPNIYNEIGTPNPGSLSDPCLGVGAFDRNSTCVVCHQNNENCTGHFGHIELSIPIYNPFLMNQLLKLLNVKCFNCHKLKLNLKDTSYLLMKLFLIKFGLFTEAQNIKTIMYETMKENTHSLNQKIIRFIKNNLLINKNYFDSILVDSEIEEEENVEIENNEEEDNKKKSKKNKQENTKIEEKIKKQIIKNKEEKLDEIFKKIEIRHKEIIS